MKNYREAFTYHENHDPIIPMLFMVDTSDNIDGDTILQVNDFFRSLGDIIDNSAMLRNRADICVVTFNSSVTNEIPFSSGVGYNPPVLQAGGRAAFNSAILKSLDILEQRTAEYRELGMSYFAPYLFCFTAGRPSDKYLELMAKERLINACQTKKVSVVFTKIGKNADVANIRTYFSPEDTYRCVGDLEITQNMLSCIEYTLRVKQEQNYFCA